MNDPNKSFQSSGKIIDQSRFSQPRIFLILIAGIFFAEVLAMIAIYFINPEPYWVETLLDASIMIVMIFPILYYFHFRPLYFQITERHRSEQLLREVLENMPVGVWIVDKDGAILHGNQASLEIWSGAKYVGIDQYGDYKAWRLDTGKPIEPNEWAAVRSIRNGETVLDEELEIECFDGSRKIILNSATPIYENSTVQGAIVVNRDITSSKRAEQALIHSNELIQKAFDSIDVLIAHMDRDFNFIQVNEAYARSAGHATDFFPGKNHFELYPHAENQTIFQQVVETAEPFSVLEKPFEYPEYPERGVTYWNWRVQPILGSDRSVQGVVLSLVDVTERKNAEMLLERQNRDLNELSLAEGKQRQLAESLVQSMLSLNASLNLQEVLVGILEQIQHSIPYEIANIVLIEDNNLNVVRYLDFTGNAENPDMAGMLFRLEDFPLMQAMCTTQQPLLIEDMSSSPQRVIPGIEGMGSCLAVPMVIGEQVIGIINLTSHQPGNFNQETARRLMAFAAPAALAVENARLYAAELRARQLAETLNAASLALTQTLNFETVMNTLLEYVCQLVPSDRAYIVISEDETNMTIQAMHGYDDEIDPIRSLDGSFDVFEKPYLQEVISSRASLLIPDTQRYPGWDTLITRQSIRSWLGIPLMVKEEAIGVLALAKSTPNFFTSDHSWLSEVIVAQAAVAIQNAWLFEQVRAGHERLQLLSRRLVEIQESERRYIARELHDEASQALTALMFGLRLLEQEVHHPENFLPRLTELKQLTDGILEELHRLAMGLRPASLDYLGLVVALEQLVKITTERYGLNIHFKVSGFTEKQRLPDHMETSVYRIVQEALTNAVRHANAKQIDVILEDRDGKTVVMIEDDGIGFDAAHIPKSGHLGVLGMQERAQMMSGTLQVESVPGCGTTIVLEVPHDDSNLNR